MSRKKPRVEEFEAFIETLMTTAPDEYEPYLLVLEQGQKRPKSGDSWSEGGPITVEKAKQWMDHGFNIGIAGRHGDELVMLDLDEPDEWGPSDIPDTLIAKSRSRTGFHAYAFTEDRELQIENMSDGRGGGVRSAWQFCVAPGSYVPADDDEVPESACEADIGYYTVESASNPAYVDRDTLTDDMRPESEIRRNNTVEVETTSDVDDEDKNPLFELTTSEVVDRLGGDTTGERFGCGDMDFPGHDKPSSTGANMAVKWDRLHCWRCNVSHGAMQLLAMYGDDGFGAYQEFEGHSSVCDAVGCSHNTSPGESDSVVVGNDEAVWCAFSAAKELGLLDEDAPIPERGVRGFMKRRLIRGRNEDVISDEAWNFALSMIEDYEPISPGREIDRSAIPE